MITIISRSSSISRSSRYLSRSPARNRSDDICYAPRTCAIRPISSDSKNFDSRDNRSLTLKDGRNMGYSDFGSPSGFPLFYFHGFPGSRLEGAVVDALSQKLNIRFLTLERPGFGISTLQCNRRVIDWASDVQQFADQLGLQRFAIMGGSGGGPYALACAHSLPRHRLSAVGLLASGGSYDKSWEHIPLRSRLGHHAARHTPWLLSALANAIVTGGKWALRNGPTGRRFEQFLLNTQEERIKNGEISGRKSGDELRQKSIRILTEGFAQGPQAFTQEALVLSTDCGFELEDVDYDPIRIYHGTKDANAPIDWIRDMAKRLPHSHMVEFEGDTHYNIDKRLEGILKELMKDSDTVEPGSS